jgi:hypothetical protein
MKDMESVSRSHNDFNMTDYCKEQTKSFSSSTELQNVWANLKILIVKFLLIHLFLTALGKKIYEKGRLTLFLGSTQSKM